jgi:S1-C subfamily serine protease
VLSACARVPPQKPESSVVCGTIGVWVHQHYAEVVVGAVRQGGPAAKSGVHIGDVLLRYNGVPVLTMWEFYRLVIRSAPGSVAHLEVLRAGSARLIDVPVTELRVLPPV